MRGEFQFADLVEDPGQVLDVGGSLEGSILIPARSTLPSLKRAIRRLATCRVGNAYPLMATPV